MCGRYALLDTPGNPNEITDLRGIGNLQIPGVWPPAPRYNAAPTNVMPVVLLTDDLIVEGMRWGLIPNWAKDARIGVKAINARAETVAEKPMFRSAFQKRRCLVPASGYFEWTGEGKEKQPHFLHPEDGGLLWFAGLWEEWKAPDGPLRSYTIVTKAADGLAATVHSRMPAILTGEAREMWLDPEVSPESLNALLQPQPHSELGAYPVTRAVGKVGYQFPDAVMPLLPGCSGPQIPLLTL